MRHFAIACLLWTLSFLSPPAHSQSSISEVALLSADNVPLDTIAFSPDGARVASGGRDNLVRLWDTTTNAPLMTLSGHTDWVTRVIFNHAGDILASASRDNRIILWDAQTGEQRAILYGHTDNVTSLAFTPDDTLLASGSRSGRIRIEHVATRRLVAELDNYGGPVWDIAFSPDGATLATAGETGDIWLWGIFELDGVWLTPLNGHTSPVTTLAYLADGAQLVSGSLDGTIRLWDVRRAHTGERIESEVLQGHLAPIMGLTVTADSTMVISASLDGTIRFWDIVGAIQKGRELTLLDTPQRIPLTHLAAHPQGLSIASVGTDGMIRFWDTRAETLEALIQAAKPVVRREQPITTNNSADNAIPNESSPRFAAAAGPMLIIPKSNIYSPITTFYLDGVSWAIDPWEKRVGHLEGTAWVNNNGNVVLGGHSQYPDGRPGIFAGLYNVAVGDEIIIQNGDTERRYIVAEIKSVRYDDLSVVYPSDSSRLTLITCDIPSLIPDTSFYVDRLVVIANAAN